MPTKCQQLQGFQFDRPFADTLRGVTCFLCLLSLDQESYFMVCGLTGFVFLTWLEAHRKYFFCFEITQHSFPPGCRELTGSCSGTRGTIVGTMNTACQKSWPVHPAGTGAVWVRSTHFCTTGPLCRLFRPWSSSNQSMCLSRSLSILLCTFPLFFYCTSSF